MSDTVGVLAKLDNGWLVAAFGRELFCESLDEAMATIRVGADSYLKMKAAAEKAASPDSPILSPKEFARSIEPGRRR